MDKINKTTGVIFTPVDVAEGAAFVEADFVGTHIRDFAAIPATGTKLHVPYCVVYDVSDDGITALRAYLPSPP